jgi:hypothetical protein
VVLLKKWYKMVSKKLTFVSKKLVERFFYCVMSNSDA